MNERKFVFDWDREEDTSKDYNPIYANRHEALLFGRGNIAGIDVASQRKDKFVIKTVSGMFLRCVYFLHFLCGN